jgi:hypothetical protein
MKTRRETGAWSVGWIGLLALLQSPVVWGAGEESPASQTVVLTPSAAPPLRIDFDFNWQKALPPFPKEPTFTGKELARGLIPTVPPTPLLRNITDNELYLNVDHSRDLVSGVNVTYRSSYNGHVFFKDLRVTTRSTTLRDAPEIPYTLDMFTYERGCAGWFVVKSGWAGELVLAGRKWRLTVVDNLDGVVGPGDTLHLQDIQSAKGWRSVPVTPVPKFLFLDGRTYHLDFSFISDSAGTVLRAVLMETRLPLGRLSIAAKNCSYLRLERDQFALILDATAGTVPIPAGTYAVKDCLLDPVPGQRWQPSFIRSERLVTIDPEKTASLQIGPPLRNTVQVTRDRNLLKLTYQVLGTAGEQYEYYNWVDRPRFSVRKGGLQVGSGVLPFG